MGLIGSALGVGGAIFGGISASKAMKKVKRNLEARKKENEDWYNRRYNEDSTQRADAQRVLTKMRESIRDRNRQAAATQAVMGGTDESVAAAKEANNEALAEAVSQIAVAGDRRKDGIEERYLDTKSNLDDRLNDMEIGKAKAIGEAASGIASAADNLGLGTAKIFGREVTL